MHVNKSKIQECFKDFLGHISGNSRTELLNNTLTAV